MESDWIFHNNRLYHKPCDRHAFVEKNKLICFLCKEPIPAELELPAQVYGAYVKWSSRTALGDMLLSLYSPKNIKQLSNLPNPIWDFLNDNYK